MAPKTDSPVSFSTSTLDRSIEVPGNGQRGMA
jgi:hypothetical protein